MLTVIRDFSYEDYKALVEKYITYDSREINFQNRVILAAFQLTKMMTWISLNSMMMKSKKRMTRNKYSL